MRQYWIVGTYNGKKEMLDCFDSLIEASKNLKEYRMAYGPKWVLDIVIK